ncbi:PQQ-binding-like beta-propeller repeat protein, partial [Chloroflexota bacterium]
GGVTAERWLPGAIVSIFHPREPWPVEDEYIWKNDLNDVIAVVPVIADSQVYVETHNGLAAISQQTGSLNWQRKIDLTGSANIAAGNGFVAAGTPNGVVVLKGDSGEKVWNYTSLFASPQSVIIAQDRLYASFAFKEACTFDLPTGEILWCSSEPGKQHSLPDMVLAGSHLVLVQSERIYALNSESGQVEWETQLDDVLFKPAVVGVDQVVVNGDKAIYSINTTDGQILWQTPSGGKGTGFPLVVDDRVFWVARIFETQSTSVQAADVKSGELLWAVDTDTEIISQPLASDGQVLWVRASYPFWKSLLLYDVETGQEITKKRFRAPIYQPFYGIGPVVDSGTLYLVSGSRIVAYEYE